MSWHRIAAAPEERSESGNEVLQFEGQNGKSARFVVRREGGRVERKSERVSLWDRGRASIGEEEHVAAGIASSWRFTDGRGKSGR